MGAVLVLIGARDSAGLARARLGTDSSREGRRGVHPPVILGHFRYLVGSERQSACMAGLRLRRRSWTKAPGSGSTNGDETGSCEAIVAKLAGSVPCRSRSKNWATSASKAWTRSPTRWSSISIAELYSCNSSSSWLWRREIRSSTSLRIRCASALDHSRMASPSAPAALRRDAVSPFVPARSCSVYAFASDSHYSIVACRAVSTVARIAWARSAKNCVGRRVGLSFSLIDRKSIWASIEKLSTWIMVRAVLRRTPLKVPGRFLIGTNRETPCAGGPYSADGSPRSVRPRLAFSAQAASTLSLCGLMGQCSSRLPDSSQ